MAIIPANTNLPKRFPQADNRHQEFFEDEHGRGYQASVDKNGDPIEDPKPLDWCAPQSPEWARGLLNPPGHLTTIQRRPGKSARVVTHLDKWMSEQEDAEQRFRTWMVNVTKKMTNGFHLQAALDNPSPELREAIGVGPFPGVHFVQAIMDGDPWALGKTEVIPQWAVALLPDLQAKARAGKLLSPAQMRALAVEERRALMARTQAINTPPVAAPAVPVAQQGRTTRRPSGAKVAKVTATTDAKSSLPYTVFLGLWRKEGKSVGEIATMWKGYKADGSHDPRLVAGAK